MLSVRKQHHRQEEKEVGCFKLNAKISRPASHMHGAFILVGSARKGREFLFRDLREGNRTNVMLIELLVKS